MKGFQLKKSLPYLKCVLRLSCVVHGVIYGRFMGFCVHVFSLYKGLPRLGNPAKRPDWSTEGKRP